MIEYTVLDGIVTSHAFDGIVGLFISGRCFPFKCWVSGFNSSSSSWASIMVCKEGKIAGTLRHIGSVAGWKRHNELDSVLGEAIAVGDSSIGERDRASTLYCRLVFPVGVRW